MENTQSTKDPSAFQKYKKDLLELKERAITLIDKMIQFNPSIQNDQTNALTTAQTLITNIQSLCKEHLAEALMQQQRERSFEDLQVNVKKSTKCRKQGIIGGKSTLVGIKNDNSFLIGTYGESLLLKENGKEIFTGKALYLNWTTLRDIVYIPTNNYYLLSMNTQLYRKDIDNRAPYLYMKLPCGHRVGACLRYSTLNRRLLMAKGYRNLKILNTKTKKIEIDVPLTIGNGIVDFRFFGQNEDRAVSLTFDCYVTLYNFSSSKNRGVVAYSDLGKIAKRSETAKALAVCDKSQYVLVEIECRDRCSRMIILRVNGDTMAPTACIDRLAQVVKFKWCLECCGSSGRHIFWAGLSSDQKGGLAQIYVYDTVANELRELEDKRVFHKERSPKRLTRFGGKLYYTGKNAHVMNLEVVSRVTN